MAHPTTKITLSDPPTRLMDPITQPTQTVLKPDTVLQHATATVFGMVLGVALTALIIFAATKPPESTEKAETPSKIAVDLSTTSTTLDKSTQNPEDTVRYKIVPKEVAPVKYPHSTNSTEDTMPTNPNPTPESATTTQNKDTTTTQNKDTTTTASSTTNTAPSTIATSSPTMTAPPTPTQPPETWEAKGPILDE